LQGSDNSDNLCPKCGLPIGWNGSGTLSSWLFRPQECQCDLHAPQSAQFSAQPGATKNQAQTTSAAGARKPVSAQDSSRFQSKQIKRCEKCNNEYSIDFADDVCSFDGSALVVADADKIVGTTIGARFKVQTLLGLGSWGTVYLAEDQHLKREVAIKIMHEFLSHDELNCKRFQREGQMASHLSHLNIATVFDCGSLAGGRPFIVMEYLNGTGLDQLLEREGELSIKRTIKIVSQLCDGLNYAHSRGVIHRDLKPGNIVMLTNDVPKILDFGLAKWDEAGESLTASGQVVGTAEYMSPEQFQGKQIDRRSDIYSLGAIIHHMLTGQTPFDGDTLFEFIQQHLNDVPKTISAARPDMYFPAALQNTVSRCLGKDPSERFSDCQTLKDALLEADTRRNSGTTKPAFAVPQKTEKSSRTTLLVIATSLAIVASVTSVLISGSLHRASSSPPLESGLQRRPEENISVASAGMKPEVTVSHKPEIISARAEDSPPQPEIASLKLEDFPSKPKSIPMEKINTRSSMGVERVLAASDPIQKAARKQVVRPNENLQVIPPLKPKITATKLPYNHDEAENEFRLPPPDHRADTPVPAKAAMKLETTPVASSDQKGKSALEEADEQGRRYLKEKNFFEAEKCFRHTLASNDKDSVPYRRALNGMVSVCIQEHRYLEGYNYALEYSKYAPPGTMVAAINHREISDCAWALKNYVVADRELTIARDIYKSRNQMQGWCNLTRRLANFKKVELDYAAALALYKEEVECRQKLGDSRLAERALENIADCQSALKKNSTSTSETSHVEDHSKKIQ
jgi:serine/threonine protein kinase